MVKLDRTDAHHPAFQALINDLDALLAELNGASHEFYARHNQVEAGICAVLAKVEGKCVGCGAFRERTDGGVEIKRMFVRPEYRGRGLGVAILDELEAWAAELGHEGAILE